MAWLWAFLRLLALVAVWIASLFFVKSQAERKASAKWRAEALSTLATASDADIRLLLGELPPWIVSGAAGSRACA